MPQLKPRSELVGVDDSLWEEIRLAFLHENSEARLRDGIPPITLKVLAERFGVPYGTLRNKASEDDWTGQLEVVAASQKQNLGSAVLTLNFQTELSIRSRQMEFGKELLKRGMYRLSTLTEEELKKLSISDALKLAEFGAALERKAAGIDDKYVPPAPTDPRAEQTREAVRRARNALESLRRRLGVERPDVELPDPA